MTDGFKVGDRVTRVRGTDVGVIAKEDVSRSRRWGVRWPWGVSTWEYAHDLRLCVPPRASWVGRIIAETPPDPRHHVVVPAELFDQVVGDLMGLAQSNYDQVATETKIRDALSKSLAPKHKDLDPDLVNALRALRGLDGLTVGPLFQSVLWQYIVRLQDAVLAAHDLIIEAADEVRLIEAAGDVDDGF